MAIHDSSELYSESFLYGARIMYINFLIHIYLEKHQGDQAMQVRLIKFQVFNADISIQGNENECMYVCMYCRQ